MRTLCQVHKSAEERKQATQWIYNEHKPWENGERLYKINCAGCHKIDGTAATGPALNLIWGETENLHGGGTIPVDENYVRDSILYPDKHVVAGYGPVSKMNSFQGKLSDVQIDYLISYMKYLKLGETDDEPAAEPTGNDDAAPSSDSESGRRGAC